MNGLRIVRVPTCCPEVGFVVTWEEADPKFGPAVAGWAVATDMRHAVNVQFCPFCGRRLDPRR